MKPGNARPDDPPDPGQLALELPSALPSLALEPEWKAQPRLWGHTLHPMCSYLASFPAALAHAFIARYSRPGRRRARSVLRPRHGAAPGGGRGPDRRRQRPQPARPRADRRQGRARQLPAEARTRRRGPAARLGRRRRRAGSTSPSGSWRGPATRRRSCRPPARGDGPDARTEPVPDEVALAFHPRTLAQLLLVRSRLRPRRPASTGSSPARWPGSSTARRRPTCRRSCPTRSAWRRATCRDFVAAHGFRAARARRVRRPGREARPPVPPAAARSRRASRSWATRGPPVAARARRFAHVGCRIAPASSSPRRPTCACSSTATTTGSGRGCSGSTRGRSTPQLDDAHHRERRTSRSCATVLADLRPALTDDGIAVARHRRRGDRSRQAVEGGHRPRRARLGGGRVPVGLPARRASSATRSRPTAR